MATIVSSQIVEDAAQVDGRRHIRERHVDSVGAVHFFAYVAAAEFDASAALAARAAALPDQLRDRELEQNLANALSDDIPAPSILYSTKLQFGAVLREAYRTSKARDAMRLGWYVDQFELTDNQIKALFSVKDAQLPAVKAKLAGLAADYEAMQQQVGE